MLLPLPFPLPRPQGRDRGRDAVSAGGAAKAAVGADAEAGGVTGKPLDAVKAVAEVDASSDSSRARSDWASRNEGSGVFVFNMEAMPRRGSLTPWRRAINRVGSLTG